MHSFHCTKMKFSMRDLFSKCNQIRRKLRIWSNLLKKSFMENFIVFAVVVTELIWSFAHNGSKALLISKQKNFCHNIWAYFKYGKKSHQGHPLNTGCQLNLHKTFRRPMYVLCTINLRPASKRHDGSSLLLTLGRKTVLAVMETVYMYYHT